jgi:hypothetical protein
MSKDRVASELLGMSVQGQRTTINEAVRQATSHILVNTETFKRTKKELSEQMEDIAVLASKIQSLLRVLEVI